MTEICSKNEITSEDTNPKPLPKVQKHIPLLLFYFEKYRFIRLLSALSGAFALIPATIDYEIGYSIYRTRSKCMINTEYSIILRSIVVFLSILGIILQLLSKFYYFKYINALPFSFEELPPRYSTSYLELIELLRKRKFKEYIVSEKTWIILILFLINPYPGIYLEIIIHQQVLYEK